PENVEPVAAVALRVADALARYVPPPVTVPLPVPARAIVSVTWVGGAPAKVATHVRFAFGMVRVAGEGVLVGQAPPPLQPLKVEPAAGVAVTVTSVPPV